MSHKSLFASLIYSVRAEGLESQADSKGCATVADIILHGSDQSAKKACLMHLLGTTQGSTHCQSLSITS